MRISQIQFVKHPAKYCTALISRYNAIIRISLFRKVFLYHIAIQPYHSSVHNHPTIYSVYSQPLQPFRLRSYATALMHRYQDDLDIIIRKSIILIIKYFLVDYTPFITRKCNTYFPCAHPIQSVGIIFRYNSVNMLYGVY